MKTIILFVLSLFELATALFCSIKKSCHTTAGYIIIAVAAVLFAVTIFFAIKPIYELPEPKGQYKVLTQSETYTDKSRIETYLDSRENRWLNVQFWYPESTNEKYPLVVFSHGSFGVKESNVTLFKELASRGYVVCSIDHTYQCLSTVSPTGEKIKISSEYMSQITKSGNSTPERTEQTFEW